MKVTREEAFAVLGVSEDASETDIKSAYKKMALKWHPDKAGCTPDAEDKMKQINAAFARLSRTDDCSDDDCGDIFREFGADFGGEGMPPEMFMFFMSEIFGRRGGRRGGGMPFMYSRGSSYRRGGSYTRRYTACESDDDYDDYEEVDDEDDDYFQYQYERSRRRKENETAEEKLAKHKEREAARLAEAKRKAEVLKYVAQLPRPVKTEVTETAITITIDRNGKCNDKQLPPGGVWELHLRKASGPPAETQWQRVGDAVLVKTTVKVSDLMPATQYVMKARGGYKDTTGEVSWCNFSVEAQFTTMGKTVAASTAPDSSKQRRKRGAKDKQESKSKEAPSQAPEDSSAQAALDEEASQRKRAQEEALQQQRRAHEEALQQQHAQEAAEKRAQEEAIKRQLEKEAAEYEQLQKRLEQQRSISANVIAAPPAAKRKKKKNNKNRACEEEALPEVNRDVDDAVSAPRPPAPPPTFEAQQQKRAQEEAVRRDAELAAREQAMLQEAIERSKRESYYVPPADLSLDQESSWPSFQPSALRTTDSCRPTPEAPSGKAQPARSQPEAPKRKGVTGYGAPARPQPPTQPASAATPGHQSGDSWGRDTPGAQAAAPHRHSAEPRDPKTDPVTVSAAPVAPTHAAATQLRKIPNPMGPLGKLLASKNAAPSAAPSPAITPPASHDLAAGSSMAYTNASAATPMPHPNIPERFVRPAPQQGSTYPSPGLYTPSLGGTGYSQQFFASAPPPQFSKGQSEARAAGAFGGVYGLETPSSASCGSAFSQPYMESAARPQDIWPRASPGLGADASFTAPSYGAHAAVAPQSDSFGYSHPTGLPPGAPNGTAAPAAQPPPSRRWSTASPLPDLGSAFAWTRDPFLLKQLRPEAPTPLHDVETPVYKNEVEVQSACW